MSSSDEKPEVGEYYRHFKGNIYRVEDIAKHSETLEELVIYRGPIQRNAERHLWARPIAMWFDHIERDTYQGPRFVPHTGSLFNEETPST
jgi:hypothetical protein